MKIGDVYEIGAAEWAGFWVRLVKHYAYKNVWLVQRYSHVEGNGLLSIRNILLSF